MPTREFNGIPVVHYEELEEVISAANLVRDFLRGPMPLEEFLNLPWNENQRALAERFQPQISGMTLVPVSEEEQEEPYYRVSGKSWATAFGLVETEEYGPITPIIFEWKHGIGKITGVPPSGRPNEEERAEEPRAGFTIAGSREFREETGIWVLSAESLSPNSLPVDSRTSDAGFWPVLVNPYVGDYDPSMGDLTKRDSTEHQLRVLMPLRDWLYFIDNGLGKDIVPDDCGVTTTYLALRKLNRLSILLD